MVGRGERCGGGGLVEREALTVLVVAAARDGAGWAMVAPHPDPALLLTTKNDATPSTSALLPPCLARCVSKPLSTPPCLKLHSFTTRGTELHEFQYSPHGYTLYADDSAICAVRLTLQDATTAVVSCDGGVTSLLRHQPVT